MDAQSEKPKGRDDVVVQATFAAAAKPFSEKFSSTATVAAVLEVVMAFFKITSDGTTRYYFVANSEEAALDTTVGQIAEDGPGHSRSIKLSLRTETISGG